MITEIVPRVSHWEETLCAIELDTLETFRAHLAKLKIEDNHRVSSQLRSHVKLFFNANAWIANFKFAPEVPEEVSDVNYRFDGILDLNVSTCSHRHRFLVEICFDNRQTIGTNLLKFELGARLFESDSNKKALGIMLCADRKSLRNFGWDESAASSEEYEVALRGPYGKILDHQPTLLVIRG